MIKKFTYTFRNLTTNAIERTETRESESIFPLVNSASWDGFYPEGNGGWENRELTSWKGTNHIKWQTLTITQA